MRYLSILLSFIFSLCTIYAQVSFSKISLSGFRVNLIHSDIFSIQVEDSVGIEKVIKNDVLGITVLDQRGRVPKGDITIYTSKLDYLNLHNCQLVMEVPIVSDSLRLVTVSSFGTLKINSDYLSVNLTAGSNIIIEGETKYYKCGVGAGSTLQSSKLIANKASVNVMGYSNVVLNAKEIIESKVENGNVKNIYE